MQYSITYYIIQTNYPKLKSIVDYFKSMCELLNSSRSLLTFILTG